MMVSVCMITYNHEKYLRQAIDGVLMQKTNFDFELVIANDKSPDTTVSVVQDCIDNHPNGNKIRFLNRTQNMGMMPNFIDAISSCKGKYVALCEGDDYWTNENKLQQQLDFLEQNPDFSICFHHVNIDNNGEIAEDTITQTVAQQTTIEDLAKGNYIHTCSVMYRNKLFKKFPKYFHKAPVGDYFLHLLNARYGKIYCIPQTMANYRVHDTSYWSSKEQLERVKIWVGFLKNILPSFNSQIRKSLKAQIERFKVDLPRERTPYQKLKAFLRGK